MELQWNSNTKWLFMWGFIDHRDGFFYMGLQAHIAPNYGKLTFKDYLFSL